MKSIKINKYKFSFVVILFLLFFQGIIKAYISSVGLFPTLLTMGLFYLFILSSIYKNKIFYSNSIEIKFLLIYYFYLLITLVYSNNIIVSIVGLMYELKLLIFIVFLMFFYHKIKNIDFIENSLYIFLILVVFSAILQSMIPPLDNLFQTLGGYSDYMSAIADFMYRPNSLLLNLFDYAFVSVFLVYLSIEKLRNNKFHYIVFFMALYGVLISFTRSSWILLAIFLTFLVFSKEKSYKPIKISMFFILVFVVIYVLSNEFLRNFILSIYTLEDPMGSAKGHIRGIVDGLAYFKQWYFGYGLGLTSLATQYFAGTHLVNTESAWISLLVEIGILGTFFYVLFLFILIFKYPLKERFFIFAIIVVMIPSLHIHYSNIFMLCLAFLIIKQLVMQKEKSNVKNLY